MLSEVDIKSTQVEKEVYEFFVSNFEDINIIYRPLYKIDNGYYHELIDICIFIDNNLYLVEIKNCEKRSKHWKYYKETIKQASKQLNFAEKIMQQNQEILYDLADLQNLKENNFYDIKKQNYVETKLNQIKLNKNINIFKILIVFGIDKVSKKVKRYSISSNKYEKIGSKYGGLLINPTEQEYHTFYYNSEDLDIVILSKDQLDFLKKYIKSGLELNNYFNWRKEKYSRNICTREQVLLATFIEEKYDKEVLGYTDYSDTRIMLFEES